MVMHNQNDFYNQFINKIILIKTIYRFSKSESSKGIAPVKRIFLRSLSLVAQLAKHHIACSRTLTLL
jgi:hypothetical protein